MGPAGGAGIEEGGGASEELAELALGGTATGTGINTHPEFAGRLIRRINAATGLDFSGGRGPLRGPGSQGRGGGRFRGPEHCGASLMKIADDIRWLASGPTSGLHEIRLPAVQPGSSIMPGKVNPVMAEALMMVAARVMGNHTTITIAGSRGNLELNVMMPLLASSLLESISLLAGGCRAFTERCVVGIEANADRAGSCWKGTRPSPRP